MSTVIIPTETEWECVDNLKKMFQIVVSSAMIDMYSWMSDLFAVTSETLCPYGVGRSPRGSLVTFSGFEDARLEFAPKLDEASTDVTRDITVILACLL